MQYHNADRAVVFGDNGRLERLLKEAESRRLENERARREQEQKDIQMNSLVGDAFNDRDYLTGTEYDPFFQKTLEEKRQKYAQMIKNNSMDLPTIQQLIQKDVSGIASTSLAVKNFRNGLKDYVKAFDPKSGMIPKNIEALAVKKFLFNPDGKLKDPSELSGTPDEIAQMVVNEYPELTVNESIAMSTINKSFGDNAYELKQDEKVSKKGTTKRYKIDYKLFPYQEFDRNPDGSIKVDESDRPIVRIKSQVVRDQSGKIIGQELSDDVFNSFTSSPQGVAVVQSKFKQLNNALKANGRTAIEDGTPEAIAVKKQLVKDMLSRNNPIRSDVIDYDVDATRKQAVQGGYAPAQKEPKPDDSDSKFENTPTGRLLDLHKNGVDTSGLDRVDTKDVSGYSVKGIVGNFKGSSGKEYADIVYNPNDKTFSFIPVEDSEPIKKVPSSEIPAMLRSTYKVNGIKNEDLGKISQKKKFN